MIHPKTSKELSRLLLKQIFISFKYFFQVHKRANNSILPIFVQVFFKDPQSLHVTHRCSLLNNKSKKTRLQSFLALVMRPLEHQSRYDADRSVFLAERRKYNIRAKNEHREKRLGRFFPVNDHSQQLFQFLVTWEIWRRPSLANNLFRTPHIMREKPFLWAKNKLISQRSLWSFDSIRSRISSRLINCPESLFSRTASNIRFECPKHQNFRSL